MGIEQKPYGETPDGIDVGLFTLTNSNGLRTEITNYGGIVTSLLVPDRDKKFADIVLGHKDLEGYIKDNSPYFNAIIGRCGNRIGMGKFTLDGVEYTLAQNNGKNHLHGGLKGFDKVVWNPEPMDAPDGPALKLTYKSKDMEEGYPGNLSCTVIYTLTENDELRIDYEATTDKPTICNLTNHCYFNLAGQGLGNNYDHELMINADNFTPVEEGLITTGQISPVKGTPMDFMKPTKIGARIDDDYDQLNYGGGYDHNWVLNKKGDEISLAAKVCDPGSGRVMEVWTKEPGVQFYSGNFLDGTISGKEGKVYEKRFGFCLETQHYPDSPNKPDFPSVVLNPGDIYETTTIHKFSVR